MEKWLLLNIFGYSPYNARLFNHKPTDLEILSFSVGDDEDDLQDLLQNKEYISDVLKNLKEEGSHMKTHDDLLILTKIDKEVE